MKKEICTFYLVRHGETEWNKKGLIQGHTDIDLSERGVTQAQGCAEIFKDVAFASVVSSDLKRAQQTASILIKGREVPFNTTHSLRERSWGSWEGRTFDDLRNKFGRDFDHFSGADSHQLDGIETHMQAVQRVEPFLHETASSFLGKSVLVVTHGGVLKGLLIHLRGEPFIHAHFDNLGRMKVQSDGEKLTFVQAHGLILDNF